MSPVFRVAFHLSGVLRVPAPSLEAAERAVADGFPDWCAGEVCDKQLTVEALGEVEEYVVQPEDVYIHMKAE